jgi:hypothetical protein
MKLRWFLIPSSLSRRLGDLDAFFGRQRFSSSGPTFFSAKTTKGDGGGVFLWFCGAFGKLDYAVNDILGNLVNIFACTLRHKRNIAQRKIL